MTSQTLDRLTDMVVRVAEALGQDLLKNTAFVGGITTGLLLTDHYAKQHVRATDDVDLIISAIGYVENVEFEDGLRKRGFKDDIDSGVICRKLLGDIQVDFMPTDNTLGFTNRWYKSALKHAQPYEIKPGLSIRLLTPAYFIATKLEAYNGRGNGNILESRDLEDIISLIDGRDSLIEDVEKSDIEMLQYIAKEFIELLKNDDFDYLLQSATNGNSGRIEYLIEKINALIELAHG